MRIAACFLTLLAPYAHALAFVFIFTGLRFWRGCKSYPKVVSWIRANVGFVQLRLEAPVVAVAGERFIIRSYSPSQTTAGGLILDPLAAKHRGRDLAQVRQRLEKLMVADGAGRISLFVESSGNQGQRFADLAARTGWTDATLTQMLNQAKERRRSS